MMKPLVAAATVLLLLLAVAAGNAKMFPIFRGTQGPLPPLSITSASIAPSSPSYTSGVALNTLIGSASATLSVGSFTGSWSTSGAAGADFTFTGNSLQTNGSTPTCTSATPLSLNIVATQPGVATPFPQAITVTCNPSGGGGGGIPCAVGPNYTGTIPADAQAAGFTTCVFNSDFSLPYFSNPLNWLFCGANQSPPTPVWNLLAYGSGPNPPCSDVAIISDPVYGNTTLNLKYTLTDAANGTYGSNLHSTWNTNQGNFVPVLGMYLEFRQRLSVSTDSNCSRFDGTELSCEYMAFFVYGRRNDTSVPFIESDFLEQYYFGNFSPTYSQDGGGGIGFNAGASGSSWNFPTFHSAAGYNPTVYSTFGLIYTNDGVSNMATCQYYNGVKIGCGTGTFSPSSIATQTSDLGFNVGTNNNGPVSDPPAAERDLYMNYILLFSCANWATGNCPGPMAH
jgi:hypothetical protein